MTLNPSVVRDELMVKLINGVTKAGVEPDQKKAENKKRGRKRVEEEEE